VQIAAPSFFSGNWGIACHELFDGSKYPDPHIEIYINNTN